MTVRLTGKQLLGLLLVLVLIGVTVSGVIRASNLRSSSREGSPTTVLHQASASFLSANPVQGERFRILWHIEPSIPPLVQARMKSDAAVLEARFGSKGRGVLFQPIVFTSSEWALAQVRELKVPSWITADFTNPTGTFGNPHPCSGYLNGFSDPWAISYSPQAPDLTSAITVFDLSCSVHRGELLDNEDSLVQHEMTHVLQYFGWAPPSGGIGSCIPAFIIEGQAQFVEAMLAPGKTGDTMAAREANWYRFQSYGDTAQFSMTEAAIASNKRSSAAYSDGAAAVQYLVAHHGWPTFLRLFSTPLSEDCGRTNALGNATFERLFQSTFGQSIAQFEGAVKPYLREMHQNSGV